MPPESRILVIDDEEVVLDSCTAVLASGDCEVLTAGNGTAGLARLEETTPDLVFVDLKMPGLSGLEVLEQIRAKFPLMVVIVITGYATVSSAVEAMKKGAFDFLPKPFTPEELRDEIERTEDFIGIGGTFTFSETDHNGLSESDLTLYRVEGGEWTLAEEAR